MADEEEEGIVVTVADEPKSGDREDPVSDLKAQYDEIQKQQQDEQEARQAAEARAQEAELGRRVAEEQARKASTEVADTRLASIEQAIESAKAEADSASNEYASALEAGDWKKAAEAQRKMARAEARGIQQEQFKQAWEAQKQQPQQPVSTGDRFEDYIRRVERVTPNSAQWLRNHRDWLTDERKNAQLTAAHFDAVANDIAVDTPAYFEHVERKIGLRAEAKRPNGNAGNGNTPRRQAAPVAPVMPSPGGTSGGGGNEVRLTQREALAATDGTLIWNYDDPSGQKKFKKGDPIGIQEMAKRKRAGMAQGLYDKGKFEV
jgi:hypothetical protein